MPLALAAETTGKPRAPGEASTSTWVIPPDSKLKHILTSLRGHRALYESSHSGSAPYGLFKTLGKTLILCLSVLVCKMGTINIPSLHSVGGEND